jgi:hypothetical protein
MTSEAFGAFLKRRTVNFAIFVVGVEVNCNCGALALRG